jgi:hypothetical protein
LDSKEAASTSAATEAEYEDVSEDEEDSELSPFQFCCTQDTLAVGWDCGSPQQRSRKKLGK